MPSHRDHRGPEQIAPGPGRVGVARKGALPVAEQATAAAQQPLALADRYAGREGLAATRTIDPYEGGGSDPLRQGFAMPPPLGQQGEACAAFAARVDVGIDPYIKFRGGG